MYAAQIQTFDNVYTAVYDFFVQKDLYQRMKFTVVGMGSLLDTIDSPIHTSMREINNKTRDLLSILAQKHDNHHTVMLSLSTVATDTEKLYRKFADQTYRLS
jgi:hypothetical protein